MAETLIAQIARHEGLRLLPYVDSVGKVTIGYGRNLTDCGVSEAEARAMLERDVNEAAMDLWQFSWFAALDRDDLPRANSLINMRFNLGPSRFRGFRFMLKALGRKDYAAAEAEMRKSKWYRQVGARGEELAATVETGRA